MSRRIGVLALAFLAGVADPPASSFGQDARPGTWILPGERLGIRTAPILLLTRPEVQADLRFDARQAQSVQEAIEGLTARAMALRGKTGAAVLSERRAIDEAQNRWLGENLSAQQLERLQQVDIQWEGPASMLSRPTVAESLNLTPEQRRALTQLVSEHNSRRARGLAGGAEQSLLAGKVEGLLDPTQRELWGRIRGTPCPFPAAIPTASRTKDDSAARAGHSQPQPSP